jgi:eukaryotic-like serine/threonine-protein kinase
MAVELVAGSRLGPYEIETPLGAGGMGEVYRARDTRLDRTVAIKVLSAQLAADPQFRQRFDREARAISALEHPHICSLYDVGEQTPTTGAGVGSTSEPIAFLVMQYLEGQTLADRLVAGALPLDQSLRYAMQIADALDKAHRAGIVHRDLKPGNIMLTKSGVKLLDFGLAKAAAPIAGAGLSMLPTTPPNLTAQGAILGTLQYMAPEQLEGGNTDARTDIFAFGAVLHEMVTGKRVFEGRSQASLISAIMSTQPAPVSSLQPLAPTALDHIVARCLAKDVDERWQSAHDLKLQLAWIAEGKPSATQAVITAAPRWRERVAWVIAALALLGALGLMGVVGGLRGGGDRATPASQFVVLPPDDARFASDVSGQAISPDGRQIVFVAMTSNGAQRLWLRALDSLTPRVLEGSDNAGAPFWSPDSRSIAFFADGKLKRLDLDGGSPQTLADAPFALGGSWGKNGTIVYVPNLASPAYRVSAKGGTAVPITRFDRQRGEFLHGTPSFLPDGNHFLFFAGSQESGVYAGSLDSQDVAFVIRSEANAIYVPPGYLLFLRGSTLMAQPFDAERLTVTGEASSVVENVNRFINVAGVSASDNGTLLARPATAIQSELVWFNRLGTRVAVAAPAAEYVEFALSPDESQIAFDRGDLSGEAPDVWLLDVRRGSTSRLTTNPSVDNVPIWSADGRTVAYASEHGRGLDIYQRPANQSAPEQVLLKLDASPIMFPADWSPDGRYLAYYRTDPQQRNDVWVLPLFGDRKPFALIQTEFNEWQAQFSPDGKWIAYVSDESGMSQVYVQAFPMQSGKVSVSTRGGMQPRWRRDGKELFYLAPDRKLMAVPVKSGTTFEVDSPRPLFQTTLDPTTFRQSYAVSADGNRFLLNTPVETVSQPLTVVLNWPALLTSTK